MVYGLPSILKGYIDRVWAHGFAYGNGKGLPIKQIRWIGLVGDSEKDFKKRNFDTTLKHILKVGLGNFVKVEDTEVLFLYDTIKEFENNIKRKEHYTNLFMQVEKFSGK
ncbi:NAD(P)H-dependent oxidoreductase [Enterococcus faecalis]|uniref:NAD(P)H-dependent oxidoreductase n=1 Tax=Enterococcus faecalis TaxID=1351 RepID=UPI00312BFDCE